MLDRLDKIRKDYNDYQGEYTTQERWGNLLDRLTALENDVDAQMTDADREMIGEHQIEDKLFDLQNRINEGLRSGNLTHARAHKLQIRLGDIRIDYLSREPSEMSAAEKQDIYDRLDALEETVSVALGRPYPVPTYGRYPNLDARIEDLQIQIDRAPLSPALRHRYQARLDAIRTDLTVMANRGALTADERERIYSRLNYLERDIEKRT